MEADFLQNVAGQQGVGFPGHDADKFPRVLLEFSHLVEGGMMRQNHDAVPVERNFKREPDLSVGVVRFRVPVLFGGAEGIAFPHQAVVEVSWENRGFRGKQRQLVVEDFFHFELVWR